MAKKNKITLTADELRVLRLADLDYIWTERGRESIHYQTGRTIVEDLVKRGLLMVVPSGCCRKEYFPTAFAQKLMEGGGSKL